MLKFFLEIWNQKPDWVSILVAEKLKVYTIIGGPKWPRRIMGKRVRVVQERQKYRGRKFGARNHMAPLWTREEDQIILEHLLGVGTPYLESGRLT